MGAYACFVVTAPGLEGVTGAELATLGHAAEVETGGHAWAGRPEDVYAANLHLRTATRVLVGVDRFAARSFIEFERKLRRSPWQRFLAGERPVRLRVTCTKSRLYHESAVAERVREAIAHVTGTPLTQAPAARPARPGNAPGTDDASGDDDAQLFIVRFLRDTCTIRADSSGAALHRRGYRPAVGVAPLRETLAAAMLLASGWDGRAPLVDPFCGSGTIPIEAALLARRIAPGLARADRTARRFAFEHWPEFDAAVWRRLAERARSRILPAARAPIVATDASASAIRHARANAARAGVDADLRFATHPFDAEDLVAAVAARPGSSAGAPREAQPADGPALHVVTNPPWGVRLGRRRDALSVQQALIDAARGPLASATLALLTPDDTFLRALAPAAREAFSTRHGGVAVRLLLRPSPPSG